jgi:hypothetical protein
VIYDGSNPSATLLQGLSEYTNANFYSGDTIFAAERYSAVDCHYFPFPKKMTDRSIELVVKYRTAQEDPFQSRPVPTTNNFTYKVIPVSNNIRSIPKEPPVELTFYAIENTIIPLNATDVYLQIVYKGTFGSENDAVAVGFKDISEPTPFDLFNNMDNICLNGSWYTAGSTEAIAQIDTDQDGIADEWDVFPHTTQNVYLNVSLVSNPVNASPSEYMFFVQLISPGTLYRAFILSDYGDNAFYPSNYAPVVKADSRDTFVHSPGAPNWGKSGSAIKNQVDYHVESNEECSKVGAIVPCDIRYYPLMYPFRGRNLWGPAGFIMDNPQYPENSTCSWEDLRE